MSGMPSWFVVLAAIASGLSVLAVPSDADYYKYLDDHFGADSVVPEDGLLQADLTVRDVSTAVSALEAEVAHMPAFIMAKIRASLGESKIPPHQVSGQIVHIIDKMVGEIDNTINPLIKKRVSPNAEQEWATVQRIRCKLKTYRAPVKAGARIGWYGGPYKPRQYSETVKGTNATFDNDLSIFSKGLHATPECNFHPLPSTAPTKAPTKTPTKTPTKAPTKTPTKTPTGTPTKTPTKTPTGTPTKTPTGTPTKTPTGTPTKTPTGTPTKAPTEAPTNTQCKPYKCYLFGKNTVPMPLYTKEGCEALPEAGGAKPKFVNTNHTGTEDCYGECLKQGLHGEPFDGSFTYDNRGECIPPTKAPTKAPTEAPTNTQCKPYKCYGTTPMPFYSKEGCEALPATGGAKGKFVGVQKEDCYGECLKQGLHGESFGGSFTWDNRGVCATASPAKEWTNMVELSGNGKQVAVDVGQKVFNQKFEACPVVKYTRNGKTMAVYKRLTPIPAKFDAYRVFTHTWADADNRLNTDFQLFDNLDDAKGNKGAWGYCNYNDHDVGFPRDCGKKWKTNERWFSMPGAHLGSANRHTARKLTNGAGFSIQHADDCLVSLPKPAPVQCTKSVTTTHVSAKSCTKDDCETTVHCPVGAEPIKCEVLNGGGGDGAYVRSDDHCSARAGRKGLFPRPHRKVTPVNARVTCATCTGKVASIKSGPAQGKVTAKCPPGTQARSCNCHSFWGGAKYCGGGAKYKDNNPSVASFSPSKSGDCVRLIPKCDKHDAKHGCNGATVYALCEVIKKKPTPVVYSPTLSPAFDGFFLHGVWKGCYSSIKSYQTTYSGYGQNRMIVMSFDGLPPASKIASATLKLNKDWDGSTHGWSGCPRSNNYEFKQVTTTGLDDTCDSAAKSSRVYDFGSHKVKRTISARLGAKSIDLTSFVKSLAGTGTTNTVSFSIAGVQKGCLSAFKAKETPGKGDRPTLEVTFK